FHSATRDAEIQAFFDSNFDSSLMGGQVQELDIREVDTATKTLEVSTSGTVNTVFMRLFGFDTVSIAADAETTSKQTGLQLVMVLDNTGSMREYAGGTRKIDALKTSAKAMVNNLFGDDATNDKLEIAIVPYVTTVNIGHLLDSSYIDTSSMPASYTYDANNLSKWNGCVEARHTNSDLTAADAYDVRVEHEGEDWVPFLWRPHYDNVYNLPDLNGPEGAVWPAPDYQREGGSGENDNSDAGPNINCPTPVLDFTSTKADLTTYIDSLYYSYNRGGTIANIGMIWGWRMLHTGSPFFNDVAYDDDKMVKAVVLMTDGENKMVSSGKKHPFYDSQNKYNDNNDAWDDDGDGKCPQCATAMYDDDDEDYGIYRMYDGDYSGYGIRDEGRLDGATSQNDAKLAINKRLAYVCSAMKGMGITVYTITFGDNAATTELKNLYEGCATDSGKYFHAPSSTDLDGAFEAIANDLADLRLSK
ncbi:MAG TPA: VWA domain-containing protein, partial [Emcibacteraceae bacterium]|nr:VWA domain-containing protein [Emcibacteraceae bacterium]